MKQFRITVLVPTLDNVTDLERYVAKVRYDLWSKSKAIVDGQDPNCRFKRGADGNYFFDVYAEQVEAFQPTLDQLGYSPPRCRPRSAARPEAYSRTRRSR